MTPHHWPFRGWSGASPMGVAFFALACLLAGASAALAQEVPFVGVIVEDGAELRAGPGKSYYVVGRLQQGQQVRIEEVIWGWHKVAPPQGVFSYIARDAVTPDQDGVNGTVRTDRTPVLAGSVAGPGESTEQQIRLAAGAKVQLLGTVGDYYKIAPPEGAYVFLGAAAVRRSDAAAVTTPAVASTQPVAEPAPAAPATLPPAEMLPAQPEAPVPLDSDLTAGPAEVDQPAAATANAADSVEPEEPQEPVATLQQTQISAPASVTPVDTGPAIVIPPPPAQDATAEYTPASPALADLEKQLAQDSSKPLEEQPLAQWISGYEALEKDPNLNRLDRWLVNVRLNQLRRSEKVAQAIRTLAESRSSISSKPSAVPATPVSTWVPDFTGQLRASGVYDGSRLPRLYRLVDPKSQATIGYVRPTERLDPVDLLGRDVHIDGEMRYDRALRLQVIEVNDMRPAETATPAHPE